MKNIKIALPVFLLLIVFFISGRYFLFLSFIEFQKTTIKKEAISNNHTAAITRNISTNDLYKNTNSIEWKDNNSEVVIDGIYYEVIQINKSKTGYNLLLKSDEKESDYYSSYFKIKNEDESGRSASVIQLLLNILFITNLPDHSFSFISDKIIHPAHKINFKLSDHLHRLVKPPCFS